MKADTNKINTLKEEAIISALKGDFGTVILKSLHHLQQNHPRRDLKIQMLGTKAGSSMTLDLKCGHSLPVSVSPGLSD